MADAAEAAVAGRDLPPPARAPTPSPSRRSAWPTMPAHSPRRAHTAARAHRRDAVDELGLADRLHLLRPVGAVHRAALDKDALRGCCGRCRYRRAARRADSGTRAIPQMMVRIDDRQRRLDDLLLPLRPPCRIAVTRVVCRSANLPCPSLTGAAFWARATPDDSAAPPSSPAVPLSNVRRDTDCRRTVFFIMAVPSNASIFDPLRLRGRWSASGLPGATEFNCKKTGRPPDCRLLGMAAL